MNFTKEAERHLKWLEKMGWAELPANSLTTMRLVQLGLIASEVGETINVVREHPMNFDDYEEELADIVLRVMGLAARDGVDLEAAILAKMDKNERRGNRGRVV